MSFISSIAPNGVISGPLPNALAQAGVLASAVAETAPTAKLLLPNAVVASAVIPAYVPEQAKATKTVARVPVGTPSSQMAAQFIAQTPGASAEELAIFEQRTPPAPLTPDPHLPPPLAEELRLAPPATTAPPPTNTAAALATFGAQQTSAIIHAVKTPVMGELRALSTPSGTQAIYGKKPGVATARGSSAYQVASVRNAAILPVTERAPELAAAS